MSVVHLTLNDAFEHANLLDDLGHLDLFLELFEPPREHPVSFSHSEATAKELLGKIELEVGEGNTAAVPLHVVAHACLDHSLWPVGISSSLLLVSSTRLFWHCEELSHHKHVSPLELEDEHDEDADTRESAKQTTQVPQPVQHTVDLAIIDLTSVREFICYRCLE